MRKFTVYMTVFLLLVIFRTALAQGEERIWLTDKISVPAERNGCGWISSSVTEREKPSDLAGLVVYGFRGIFGKNISYTAHYDCPPVIESVVLTKNARLNTFRTSTTPHGSNPSGRNGFRTSVSENENAVPVIDEIIFDRRTINAGCTAENCGTIKVKVRATDPENDPLTYNYTASGGRIIGHGSEVIWDLRGVEPGDYTITVTVDDGCGVCAEPKTETVRVLESSGHN
jgi:hypothetical protein